MADTDGEATSTDAPEVAPINSKLKPSITVKVYAPFQIYFDGAAQSLSAVNATGPFDILPHHRNFLCILLPCELVIKKEDGTIKKIKVHRALLNVKDDRVVVFMDV